MLDDDASTVFQPSGSSFPPFQSSSHHSRRNADQTRSAFQPPGSFPQLSQPQVQPLGRAAVQPQPPFQPEGMNNQATSYANAIAAGAQNNTNQPSGQHQQPFRPRKQSTLLYGKSRTGKDNQTQLLAANVNLVASGVSKGATDQQLKNFLEDKGIKVTEIQCLTYHPDARTNTFRVAIAIEDYEKALNPEVWPYRVAVRSFRPPRRDREQRSMEAQFGRAGGVVNTQQQAHQVPQAQEPQQPQQPQQHQRGAGQTQTPTTVSPTPEVIEVSNKYETLASMDDADN